MDIVLQLHHAKVSAAMRRKVERMVDTATQRLPPTLNGRVSRD